MTLGERQIWQTTPRARSEVPLPGLPAYLATQVAVSPERQMSSSDFFIRMRETRSTRSSGRHSLTCRHARNRPSAALAAP